MLPTASGLEVEFEIPDRKTAAMRDDADLTIFLYEGEVVACPGISFTIQLDDVEAKNEAWSQPVSRLLIRQ